MTPLTAEKIAELERLLAALGTVEFQADHDEVVGTDGDALLTCYSNAHHGYSGSGTAALIAEAINALPNLLSLAKRVVGAPVGTVQADCEHGPIVYAESNLIGKRIALVEIVGGEE
jgi:hypothetical protein